MKNYNNEYMNELPNFSRREDYGYTGKVLHEMLSRKFHPAGGPINTVVATEMALPDRGSEHDIVHEMMYRIVHEIEKKTEGHQVQGIEVIMQSDPMLLQSRIVVRVGTRKPEWRTVEVVGTAQKIEQKFETTESAPQSADRILPD